jgi:hypothetical protein
MTDDPSPRHARPAVGAFFRALLAGALTALTISRRREQNRLGCR